MILFTVIIMPFCQVVKGMDVVDKIYKIGERPNQGQILVPPPPPLLRARSLSLPPSPPLSVSLTPGGSQRESERGRTRGGGGRGERSPSTPTPGLCTRALLLLASLPKSLT